MQYTFDWQAHVSALHLVKASKCAAEQLQLQFNRRNIAKATVFAVPLEPAPALRFPSCILCSPGDTSLNIG